jgi:Putative Flp pilus-assembly TadE/G-like
MSSHSRKTVSRDTHLNWVAARSARRRARGERGYVLVITSIVLPVLVLCIALATDVTYLYARSIELQRVADSAALAGVTRMPRQTEASDIALNIAKKNGVEHNSNGVTVVAEPPSESNRRLKVTVRDQKVPLFFGRIFKEYWDVTRSSTAEYVSNIPLGSVLNAIGTGDMFGADTTGGTLAAEARAQNFWLSVAGPCVPKENGDQLSSRYDGNSVNPDQLSTANKASKYFRLCDYVATDDETARLAKIAADQTAANATVIDEVLFPATSINRDYDRKGYNYIVEVPCTLKLVGGTATPISAGEEPPSAPCLTGDVLTGPMKIDVFDPVFNPDSIQQFVTSKFSSQIKPDSLQLFRKIPAAECRAAALINCQGGAVVTGQPLPQDTRVSTDFRVYAPNGTPYDYDDDTALEAPLLVAVKQPNGVVLDESNLNRVTPNAAEANRVQRFGSCINYTDEWTYVDGTGVLQRDVDANHDYVPDGSLVGTREPVNSAILSTDVHKDTMCAANAARWRTLATIPIGTQRGRFRVNVRTIASPSSFGINSFSLRAALSSAFTSCDSVTSPASCPAVSGDSSMSVFAAVPKESRFFLARLAPATLYRNKTIVVQLWDPGEGGEKLEVLRPTNDLNTCDTTTPPDPSTYDNDGSASKYCIQKFDWSVWNPGLNKYDSVNAFKANGEALGDSCASFGQTDQSSLQVSGDWNSFGDPLPSSCAAMPAALLESRQGFSPKKFDKIDEGSPATPAPCTNGADPGPDQTYILCGAGRFNDRTVAVQIKIPNNYGCEPLTGTPRVPCVEATSLAEGGWWKIKYTPVRKPWDTTQFVGITDRTTWTVQLLGDPVHLVRPNN